MSYNDYRPSEPEKKPDVWVDYKDFNPDRQPAAGGFWVEDRDEGVAMVMSVKGLGAILFRAAYIEGTTELDFKGVSTFTDPEIGHRK